MENVDLPGLSQVGAALWRRYGDRNKLRNAHELRDQTKRCRDTVTAFPWRVVLEPTNTCNLACAGCTWHESELPRGVLQPEDVDLYLRDLWPFLVQVNLFNWGEPFLNKRLPEIIATIRAHGVGTQVHSNMNYLPAGLAEGVTDAGLDFLIASIDGITQPVYEQYRTGGSCRTAIKHLEQFVQTRDRLGGGSTKIVWRMLRFPHNAHEIEKAEHLAREIGVDDFAVAPGGLGGYVWTEAGANAVERPACGADRPHCRDLYDFPVIHWDGKVLPCCVATDMSFVWGDLRTTPWQDVFNSPAFVDARRVSCGECLSGAPCADCQKIPKPVETISEPATAPTRSANDAQRPAPDRVETPSV